MRMRLLEEDPVREEYCSKRTTIMGLPLEVLRKVGLRTQVVATVSQFRQLLTSSDPLLTGDPLHINGLKRRFTADKSKRAMKSMGRRQERLNFRSRVDSLDVIDASPS